MKKQSRKETKKLIENFFLEINTKIPKEVKKMKKISMRINLPLKEKRKLFCPKCFNPYKKIKIRIKNKKKIIICQNCKNIIGWKIK